MPKAVAVQRFRDGVYVIGDNVMIPLDSVKRAEAERAFKLIEELRATAIDEAEVDMRLVEEDRVVIAFDFSLNSDGAVVRVMQVAE
jgi:hypothetical protein